jgi:hypothetical protein
LHINVKKYITISPWILINLGVKTRQWIKKLCCCDLGDQGIEN